MFKQERKANMENIAQNTENPHSQRNIYQVKNERMGGFVPSWDAPTTNIKQESFDNILSSYSPKPEIINITPSKQDNEFGFLDLIDMVNPLQHIPIVNMAYRSLSGDEIKPISKIIGGGIFGGAIGVASGIVNAIIEEETGKDVIGNVTAFAGISKKEAPDFNNEYKAYEDLPASLLAFAETPMPTLVEMQNKENHKHAYERTELAHGRTAGMIAVYA